MPKLLFGAAVIFATVIPWLSSLRGAAAVMKAAGVKTGGVRAAGAKADGAKRAGAKAVNSDLAGLVLNATCITREQRLAIINWRVYRQKDAVVVPNAPDSHLVLAEIQPHKVVLESGGKRVPLGYPDRADGRLGTKRVADPPDKDVLPPELSDLAGDPDLNRFVEEEQQGVTGLEKMMTVLSDGKQ